MSRTARRRGFSLAIALLCAGFFACGSPDLPEPVDLVAPSERPNDAFTIRRTVERIELEGGCWTILTDQERYEPTQLPEEYRVDGLEVLAEVAPRDDLASICQVGPIVVVLRIEAL